MPAKICPRCQTEYELTANECSACGSALEAQPAVTFGGAEEPSAASLERVYKADPWQARAFVEALQAAGISSRIDSDPPGQPFSGEREFNYGGGGYDSQVAVYVEEEDVDEAVRQRDLFSAGPAGVPGPFDDEACPACGTTIPIDAHSCSGCGLEFPDLE